MSWSRRHHAIRPTLRSSGVAAVLLAVLSHAAVTVGDPDPRDSRGVLVGGFALGDGLEASIGERDGSFRVDVPVAGLQLSWDSGNLGDDASGLGPAWSWGLGRIDIRGGVEVQPISTSAAGGRFKLDATHPSGLAGYGVEDVRFERRAGVLEPRPGASDRGAAQGGDQADPPGQEYAYTLEELGGVTTYFTPAGDPTARVDRFGARSDWVWDELVPHRLIAVIDTDGVATSLDWTTEPGTVVIRPAVNLPPESRTSKPGAGTSEWRIALDGERVTSVTDASGGRIGFESAPDGAPLLTMIAGIGGGVTRLAWRAGDDGSARISRVVTTDQHGAELSAREWRPWGDGTMSSGWPRYAGESETFWSGDPAFRYQTVVTDGLTTVESEYNSLHLLMHRRVIGSTPHGDRVLQEQRLDYPGSEDGAPPDPGALPGNWSHPTGYQVTHRDAAGGSRTERESSGYDRLGRLVHRTAADGTITETGYDAEAPAGAALPIGLPVSETVTAPNGEVRTTRHTLNPERTAVVATEVTTHRTGHDQDDSPDGSSSAPPEVVTARSEFEVRPDGFVLEQRQFPGGDATQTPRVTRWGERVDLTAGTRTTTETLGAETRDATTSTETSSLRHGGLLATIDRLGNAAHSDFDELGRSVRMTDALGRVTSTTYESAQRDGRNATTVRTPDGVSTTEARDVLGRIVATVDNIRDGVAVNGHARTAETRRYPAPGVIEVTDAWGATTRSRQDVFGRTVETIAPNGLVQLSVYDDVANTVTSALTPTGELGDAELVQVETRDLSGNVIASTGTRADGTAAPTQRAEYDGFGRGIITTDGTRETRFGYDAVGNPITVRWSSAAIGEGPRDGRRSRENHRADRELTPSRALTSTRRFDGFNTSLEHILADDTGARSGGAREVDALDRTRTETDQLGRTTTVEYTPDDLPARIAAGNGQVTEHRYHPVTRALVLTSITSPVGVPVVTAHDYDPVTDRLVGVYDPDDRARTEIRFSYDAFGNPVTTRYPDGRTITIAYDEHGRRTGSTDVAGAVTALAYDDAGLLIEARQRDRQGTELASVASTYDAYGRVSSLRRGNGVETRYAFTSASEIAEETTTDASGELLAHRTYAYDTDGRLTSRTDTIPVDGREPEHTTTDYEYDLRDRLIRSIERSGDSADASVLRDTTYELTVSNDLATETTMTRPSSAESSVITRSFEYSALGELSAITTDAEHAAEGDAERRGLPGYPNVRFQAYDAAGNLVGAADGTTYVYDAANRPISQTTAEGVTLETAYWADGSRRSLRERADAGAAVEFYWDGDTLLNELHAAGGGQSVVGYLIGSSRHARTVFAPTGETTYFGSDRHGSVTEVFDAGGAVLERYRYSDYGARIGESPACAGHGGWLTCNPFGYAGEYTDPAGTQHLAVRTYDPSVARFTTQDIAALHNRYNYADANPITMSDPTGRNPAPDGWHPAIIALGVLATFMITVALTFVAPAALGTFGVVTAVTGAISTGYSMALAIGAQLAASESTTSIVSDEARAFFRSDMSWISELVVGIGLAAGAALLSLAAPRIVSWAKLAFRSPGSAFTSSSGRRTSSPRMSIELQRLGESTSESGPMPGLKAVVEKPGLTPNELIQAWTEEATQAKSVAPFGLPTLRMNGLMRRTRFAVFANPLRMVCRGFTSGGVEYSGFRVGLRGMGIPLEISGHIEEFAGYGVQGRWLLAKEVQAKITKVQDVNGKVPIEGDTKVAQAWRTVYQRLVRLRQDIDTFVTSPPPGAQF